MFKSCQLWTFFSGHEDQHVTARKSYNSPPLTLCLRTPVRAGGEGCWVGHGASADDSPRPNRAARHGSGSHGELVPVHGGQLRDKVAGQNEAGCSVQGGSKS